MLQDNVYNIDREFNYATVKDIVIKSLEKVIKEEALKHRSNIPDDFLFYSKSDFDVKPCTPPTPLLKLRIRNTTRYLNWPL
jgi:hypothetical protein